MSDILLRHVIRCHYSGLPIGSLEVNVTAGTMPYLSHWDKAIAYHPVFSMPTYKLLEFFKSEWNRLAKKLHDEELTENEGNILRVCYLACLHSLDCIRQDSPALPPLHVVQHTSWRVIALASWKFYLESQRFRFPTLHLSRFNQNLDFSNISAYIDTCFEVRNDYEKNVREIVEKHKVQSAEKALLSLQREWVTPVSRKILWNWIVAHVPDKWKPDAQGWLRTMFLSKSAFVDFHWEDIELGEEIIQSSCPYDSPVMFAVRKRLEEIKALWKEHNAAFDIELADHAPLAKIFVNGVAAEAKHPGKEPELADFPTKIKYTIALSKWKIAYAAWEKQQQAPVTKPIRKDDDSIDEGDL